MFINGEPVSKYGGIMLGTPRISNAQYTANYYQPKNASNFIHLGHEVGMKDIECYVAFMGDTIREIQLKRSYFRSMLVGKLDISFTSDGFSYFCEYEGSADLESEYDGAVVSKFKFKGIQHDVLETVSGDVVYCRSTVPQTACKLQATASTSGTNVQLGTVKFASVAANDVLVVDGIDGKILKNNSVVQADFVNLPYLVAGENTITCSANLTGLTVEYYPTYM